MKNRIFLVLAWVGSWLTLLMPIGIMIYNEKEKYFKTVENKVRLSIAFIFICIIVIPIVIKKAKMGLLSLLVVLVALLDLLKPILADLELLLFTFTISYAVFQYVFNPLINYLKAVCKAQLEANINARAMGKVFKKGDLNGSV